MTAQVPIAYPSGRTPEHLYLWAQKLVDVLKTNLQGDAANLGTALSEIQATLDDLQAQIDASGGALTPQQAYELSLVTAVEAVIGSVSSMVQKSIAESQKAAEATIRALLAGQKNKTAIHVEQFARLTSQESFAAQISTLETQMASANAAIVTESTARADGDTSNASLVNTVTSTVAGHTAQISTIQTSVNGIEQRFAVTLNSNGYVTGLVQLDGTDAGSSFTVVADKLKLSLPGVNGGDPVDVVALGKVDGQPAIVWKGTMFGDGTINAGAINATSISAIAANLGIIVAGYIQDHPTLPTYVNDIANGREYSTDGKFLWDKKNKRLLMLGA